MKRLVLFSAICFICINFVISVGMEYSALQIQKRCPCMKNNYHWTIILIYFAISCVFLMYLLYHMTMKNHRRFALFMMVSYTICTAIFIVSGFSLTLNPQKTLQSCITEKQCDTKQFNTILLLVTIIRTIMTLLTIVTLVIWFIFFYLLYPSNSL